MKVTCFWPHPEAPCDPDLANQNSNSLCPRSDYGKGGHVTGSGPMRGKFSQSSVGSFSRVCVCQLWFPPTCLPAERSLKWSQPREMRVRRGWRRKAGGVFSPCSKLSPPVDVPARTASVSFLAETTCCWPLCPLQLGSWLTSLLSSGWWKRGDVQRPPPSKDPVGHSLPPPPP